MPIKAKCALSSSLSTRNGSARNQSGTNPWYALTDYTIEDNVFTNGTNGGMNWLLQDSTADEGAYDTCSRGDPNA